MNTVTACATCPRPTRGERMTLSITHRVEALVATRVERRARALPTLAAHGHSTAAAAHEATIATIRSTMLPR